MFCDNSAALHFANELGVQRGARHYHRRYHYVCECIALGEIRFLKVHTDDNLVDPFTKALPKGKLTQHARSMGLRLASSFMIAKMLVIISTKIPKYDKQYVWEGEANSSSDIVRQDTDHEKLIPRGTSIKLHLKRCFRQRYSSDDVLPLLCELKVQKMGALMLKKLPQKPAAIAKTNTLASAAEYFFKMGIEGKRFRPTVKMADDYVGPEVEKLVAGILDGDVLLLENVRFYKKEDKNDPEFVKKLASLADLHVNDALALHT
ncbi:retrovirus-related pol polyprotein from transposon TNT 1-94 [Tanacetum coccineum]